MLARALVPVRLAPAPKRRLASMLSVAERTALVIRLLEHVLSTLEAAGLEPFVLCPHPLDAGGRPLLRDPAPTLNAALEGAVRALGLPVLVVPADLPGLRPQDVQALEAEPGDVVVARARDGGTGGLLLRAPLPPAFGERSALAHAARARALGLRARVVDLPGFARDVDGPSDLSACAGAVRLPLP